MKRIAILGGDATALLAANYFQKFGHQVLVFHEVFRSGQIASEVNYRPQIVHSSDRFLDLLKKLSLVHSQYHTHVGVMLQDKVNLYPNHLRSLSKEQATQVRNDIYKKTRLIAPDVEDRVTDYEAIVPKSAVRFDWLEFVRIITRQCKVCTERVVRVERNQVTTAAGIRYPFDFLLVTLPLWKAQQLVDWRLPDAVAVAINSVTVEPNRRDRFAPWDSIWTPYTPENLVHRVWQHEDGYHAQFSGAWEDDTSERLTGDLNYLFPSGWSLKYTDRDLPGYMFPLSDTAVWPDNVCPLGRFASWHERDTLDVCLDSMVELRRLWGL